MVMRLRPDGNGGWQVSIGQSGATVQRGGFADRAAAEEWGTQAAQAARLCSIRIGSKRFLGTAAEALQRWAIDQGTLPRSEGGTQMAPALRLAELAAEACCGWPLALLTPADLAGLRARRHAALGEAGAMLAEQAALFAALDMFREFHLPALDDPFAEVAPDGLCVLDEIGCTQAMAWACDIDQALGLAVGLMLTTAAPAAQLLACCQAQADRFNSRLHLPNGMVVSPPPGLMPPPAGGAASPLLPSLGSLARLEAAIAGIGSRMGRPGLTADALQLSALATALSHGQHLDEVLRMACPRTPALS